MSLRLYTRTLLAAKETLSSSPEENSIRQQSKLVYYIDEWCPAPAVFGLL